MSAHPKAAAATWTIGRLLNWTSEYLGRHDVCDARLAAEVLLAHSAKCRRIELYTRFDDVLSQDRLDRFREWVRRAAAHEPIAYLVEEREFFSLPLRVTPEVLIPRPESELLVECVLDHCTKAGSKSPKLLDLGTGSGCLTVAVLVHLKGATAVATDISLKALEIARFNAARHGVLDRVTFAQADRLALPKEVVPAGGFDVLMSNPPYVASDAVDKLDAAVRDYEPSIALTDGRDGLSFYKSLADDGPALLSACGVIIVEVGDGQAAQALKTVTQTGNLVHQRTLKDRVVGQERVLVFLPVEGSACSFSR